MFKGNTSIREIVSSGVVTEENVVPILSYRGGTYFSVFASLFSNG